MVTADLIIENLKASSKKQVLEALAEKSAALFFGKPEAVLHALLERERLGTTGIGCGVAIPHVKIQGLRKIYGVLARLEKPIDYDSPDGAPVDIIFMLLAPAEGKTTQHLKALAQVSRFLRDAGTCGEIRTCAERQRIAALLEEWLKKQAA